MARGTPARPAPVSGPGALARRTDGGPSQPVRTPTGGEYGEAKALTDQQQGAPLSTGPGPTTGGGATPSGPPPGGVFGPTERPGESPTTGVSQPGAGLPDPDQVLRALYSIYPHPQILNLIRRG